ncbi:MAG: DUF481 domain-containing protein [Pseudomonadales bacterium]|nr:DUF481 domain-containing protein [Pseudomonadales bacterium]
MRQVFSAVLLVLVGMSAAIADVVELKNGDRLTGTLEGVSGGKAILTTSYAGDVAINLDEVVAITSEDSFKIGTPSDYINGRFVPGSDGQQIESENAKTEVAIGDVRSASQSRLAITQLGSEWSNRADLGLVISNGNSDTQNLNTLIESIYKADDVQHQASLRISNEEAEELTTKDQFDFDYGYKRFMSERWFVAGNAEYFTDDLKDIDSRITIGAGGGYQFWDNTFGALSAEAGISAVQEEINGMDENNPAVRLALDYKRLLLANRLELFHKQAILFIPDSDRGEVLSASTGLRYSVSDMIDTIARVDLNHETKPAPGNSKTDTTYTVGVGIKF